MSRNAKRLKGNGAETDASRRKLDTNGGSRRRNGNGSDHGFPHTETLKGMDFLRVMAKGEKCSCPSFYLYHMPASEFQAGICVSRRLGGAVIRNKIKRVLRESVRLTRSNLSRPCHMVLVARRGAEELSVDQAKDSLSELYGTARLAAEAN